MSKLAEFRRRLASLKQRRRNVRLGTGYSGLALALFCTLAAAFLVDWLFQLTRTQRAISLALCAAILIWAFRRYTFPWLRQRESTLDMALLVEKQEGIDSDLVAAMQFENREAPAWGSLQLEWAVIERAAAAGRQIDVMRGLDRRGLKRRMGALALVLIIWLAATIGSPQHVGAFFNRLLLGSCHYPSRTVIESIAVNGRTVDLQSPDRTPIRVSSNRSIRFEVRCAGRLPEDAEVHIAAARGGLSTSLPLLPAAERAGLFVGQLPRLVESAAYHVAAGDAWTDAGRLIVGQLPALEVRLEVAPPSYTTTDSAPLWLPAGLRQAVVVEGSRVTIHLRADQELKDATATIGGRSYPLKRGAAPAAETSKLKYEWVLDPAEETPLAAVRDPVRYAIQITDADDQQLERPLEGMVRVQPDAPPRVAAAVVTRCVLPSAAPTIYLHAVDDYGLASLALTFEVVRADGQTEERETPIYTLRDGETPQKSLENNYVLDLGPLKLGKDDTVKVAVRATDFRGPQEGRSTSSDPVVLEVTDEQGVLAAMMEADKQSATELQDMIQRQLGIGESP